MSHAIRLLFFFCLAVVLSSNAQDKDNLSKDLNVDELGNNTDEFQEVFFRAIAQRAVENPDKAIEALEKCLILKPDHTAVFYELAKNHLDLEAYEKAEEFLKKTLADSAYQDDIYIHKQLFYVYSMQKKYDQAINEAEFISEFDPVYFQELANIYLLQNKYQLALMAIDEFDAIEGSNKFRDDYRMLIYKEGSLLDQGIEFFKNRFQNSEEDIRAATLLMQLYRLNNSPQQAIEVGRALQENSVLNPELYVEMAMSFLASKNIPEAQRYSRKVVESLTLDEKDKVKVINTFKALALQDPAAQDAFVSVLDTALSSEKNSSSKAELGQFYKSRDKDKALENFKSALRNKPNDFMLIRNILDLEIELQKYEDALATSEKALESFPSQAYLYFAKGLALGQLNKDQEAIEVLENALDYIFEDNELKQRVYLALKESYLALGEQDKAKAYEQKLIIISN
ncbi:tetratricopeptide repeat protein [Psychroflexus sediminis]|uniref:Tetratricopeptide repeat-containing protein n=1 Tax=Psychroflexus sediminis TaxID=470826 RepID=A0A1G7X4D3_9FLAO|nr:tetratricopeptide repeat protein [Psychroflexus sediminis]SDG79025.1 Tetratricopeptide repeat-containing protein [Psychroflexus sediminis]